MALNAKTAVARRNAMIDNFCANANSGILRIYDGTQPTDADTAVSTQVILAELTMGSTAFAASSAGVATANAITADTSANASGTAAWFRLYKADGTTALCDGSVGTGTNNLVLNSVAISSGALVACSAFTVSQAA